MLGQYIQHLITLLFKCSLISFFLLEVSSIIPACGLQSIDLFKGELLLIGAELQTCILLETNKLENLFNQCVLLLANVLI